MPYLDESLRLVASRAATRVHRRGDELLVPAGEQRQPALERWYRRAAREEIAAAARPSLRAGRQRPTTG